LVGISLSGVECGDVDHSAPAARAWSSNSSSHQRKFEGLFVCLISLMDRIDKAVRRFNLNILFEYLNPAQAGILFSRVVANLQGYARPRRIAESITVHLAQLRTLPPGVFATVVRLALVLGELFDSKRLLVALEEECRAKQPG
jgi:hypothetical protein